MYVKYPKEMKIGYLLFLSSMIFKNLYSLDLPLLFYFIRIAFKLKVQHEIKDICAILKFAMQTTLYISSSFWICVLNKNLAHIHMHHRYAFSGEIFQEQLYFLQMSKKMSIYRWEMIIIFWSIETSAPIEALLV